MTDATLTDLGEFELPYNRKAMLRRVDHESGLQMVRLILREGRRITQIDLDADAAQELGDALRASGQDIAPSSDEVAQETEAQGEVYLVGAGPGDPSLLTYRAVELMKQADVVLYDRLLGDDILSLVRPEAERVYVGKRPQDHTMPQEDISQLMVRLAKDGKRVLRLKGGDPFIFGRGGEEIETLAENGVPFQVVPGITAASACGTYAGIPLTHRDHAQSCTFVTAHGRNGVLDLDWDVLTGPGRTLAIYMGFATLPALIDGFRTRGMDMETPVAVVENGTRPNQKVVTGTLETVRKVVQEAGLTGPAIIIVGSVVTLRDRLSWT